MLLLLYCPTGIPNKEVEAGGRLLVDSKHSGKVLQCQEIADQVHAVISPVYASSLNRFTKQFKTAV